MENSVLPLEYRIEIPLANGVLLEQLLFSHAEHRWIFTYRSVIRHEVNLDSLVLLSNEMRVRADYKDGIMEDLEISMDIINHANRGKKFLAGVDVSPDSRMYLELKYKLSSGEWLLAELVRGSEVLWHGKDAKDRLTVWPIEIPFPVSDFFIINLNHIAIPFLSRKGAIEKIRIPVDIRKNR